MRYFPAFVSILVLFFMAVWWNVNQQIDTMSSSESARISDIGDSMAEALETSAVNVLETNINPDYKTRGVSVIDNINGKISETEIKEEIKKQVEDEFEEYTQGFNRKINTGRGVKPLFEYKILIKPSKDISIGQVNSLKNIQGSGSKYGNVRNMDQDTIDRENMGLGDYPYYKATLKIKFWSAMAPKNYTIDSSGKKKFGPKYELEYPITAVVRHVNTESQEYYEDLHR